MQIAAGCCEHNLGVTLEELPGELSLLDHFYYLKDGGVHSFRQAASYLLSTYYGQAPS